MKLTVSLLFLITAFVIGTQGVTVSFKIDVLKFDLEAILKYQAKSGNYNPAYIEWPNSITFKVHRVDNILKIDGLFACHNNRANVMLQNNDVYSGLYYSNDNFYYKTKTGDMKPMVREGIDSYTQPRPIEKAPPYLSIKYFSFEEMNRSIKSYYKENRRQFEEILYLPATFLYKPPQSKGQFMEYIFRSGEEFPKTAEGVIQVLIGHRTTFKVSLEMNKRAYRVVFNQQKQTLEIPKKLNIFSDPITDVFGVRTATIGYMSEVQQSKLQIVNTYNLDSGIPADHTRIVSSEDLEEKVRLVEPRLRCRNMFPKHRSINEALFQLHGCVWKKKINYSSPGEIDEKCPMIIGLEDEPKHFDFKGKEVTRLCANDTSLWVYE